MSAAQETAQESKAVQRAFGSENRNRLIDQYFAGRPDGVDPENAWQHVYRLLMWSDPTTGLAHCYESDKCQPGKTWYGRSLAFHDWVCKALQVEPVALAHDIDWLFIQACEDLAGALLEKQAKQRAKAAEQRLGYEGRGFPSPGEDPELIAIVQGELGSYFSHEPPEAVWQNVSQKARQYLAVQNKRKNLVGEGFEDVLTQVVQRACGLASDEVVTRTLLSDIRGFSLQGSKPNRVDVAIVRPKARTIVTAKWSVRADREKQFAAEYTDYARANSIDEQFQYVFVTNEFDPARLMRACEIVAGKSYMFDRVVHINTDGLRAAYGFGQDENSAAAHSRRRVIELINEGRLVSLSQWLNSLAAP
jgi:hypothetical protein